MWRKKPNVGHYAISLLQEEGVLSDLMTQNVDGLHIVAGSIALELHGNLKEVRCLGCDTIYSRERIQNQTETENMEWLQKYYPSNHTLHSEDTERPDGDVELEKVDYESFVDPHCFQCDSLLKPNLVFFGEVKSTPLLSSIHLRKLMLLFTNRMFLLS